MSSKFTPTRRGFLRGSIGAALVPSCAHELRTERASAASVGAGTPTERVTLATIVNGRNRTAEVHGDDSALHVVRQRFLLTGCKESCGHGACGACTMLVDGTPMATCILPATALEGRKVTTIEGVAPSAGPLHPVQRAFMAEDALQCGFCTPGFVVEAVVFHDKWRKQHGKREPDRDTIAAALSGHLCRCAAYDAIYNAVTKACAGKFDDADPEPARVDAREKVTGVARYTVDVMLKGQLVARALHSPYASARIRKLDWSKALKVPGVRGAVELLGKDRRVRFAGQEIMALAATDERTAEDALALVEVEYEVSKPVLTIEAGRDPSGPPVFARKKDRRHPDNATEGPLLPEKWNANVRGPLKLFSKASGKAKRAIEKARKAGTVSEAKYALPVQCHSPLEPHAAVAQWNGDELTVYMSTQAVTHMARDIAQRWGLRRDNVRVVARYVGGGFGGKATLTSEVIIAVELARVSDAPVGYALDRRAEIMIGGNRPGAEIEFTAATDTAGKLTGMRAIAYGNAGVAVGHNTSLLFRVMYPKAPKELLDYDAITNAPPGKPLRAPGGPCTFFAMEQALDEIAHARGEDPLKMRQRWDPNPARKPLYGWAAGLEAWRKRRKPNADRGRFKRGLGAAVTGWFVFTEPKSRLQLDAGPEGLVASTASQDIGNGFRTVIARTLANAFGIKPSAVAVRIGDSKYVHGPQSGGSRCTSSIVPACLDAAAQLKEELADAASRHFRLRRGRPSAAGIEHRDGMLSWAKALEAAPEITVVGRRKRDKGGYFFPALPHYHVAAQRYIAGGISLFEVEVDTRLGRVRVLETWNGFGTGKLVAPKLALSQAQGGIVQGISYALYEERRLDPTDGFLLNGGLEDYRIAGIGDMPKIHVHFTEHGYDRVPGRSVGLAELVALAPAAGIANAVFNATGWRPRELPLRPDVVLKGVGVRA